MADIILRSSNLDNITAGPLTARWNVAGTRVLRYYIDLRHKEMHLHRELSAPDRFILQNKVDALLASWDEKWVQHRFRVRLQSGKEAADEMSIAAAARLNAVQRILSRSLETNDVIDWEALKDHSAYSMPKRFPKAPPKFAPHPIPVANEPTISLWSRLFGKADQIKAEARRIHRKAEAAWEEQDAVGRARHAEETQAWQVEQDAFWAEHMAKSKHFLAEQEAANAVVDALRMSVAGGESEAVIEHASLVLEASDYDGMFEKSYEIQYEPNERLLLISYILPSPDVLPSTKHVRFVKATGELKETLISERDRKTTFESAAYQICLRTLHELFEADIDHNIDCILFNGHVEYVDPRTGQEARTCLLSVLVDRQTLNSIDLARVDPKACFKSLKGVSAATLASLTAIAPVIQMNREDRRFIEGKVVAGGLEQGTNLASMSWEDFEHLVRELFEQEFRSRGGEVKVTRSSSDGGVDAIAFDPDPISGGKIVIQAKRYTRTVGVAAVRDLFGTVMNEGASKGILVTTADYGPDAYQFANGKPLTLLNGANLLHLMEKHGQRARIDIQEARRAFT